MAVARRGALEGLLAGGVLYGWLEARVFVLSAAITALACVLALWIPPSTDQPEPARGGP